MSTTACLSSTSTEAVCDELHLAVTPGPRITATFRPPDWSPDGQKLVYIGPGGIYSVRVDGTNRRQLTAFDKDTDPVWSANGTKIAFVRSSSGTFAGRSIYVMNADGSHEQRLVPGVGHHSPVWAPNRPTVAFILSRGIVGISRGSMQMALGCGH